MFTRYTWFKTNTWVSLSVLCMTANLVLYEFYSCIDMKDLLTPAPLSKIIFWNNLADGLKSIPPEKLYIFLHVRLMVRCVLKGNMILPVPKAAMNLSILASLLALPPLHSGNKLAAMHNISWQLLDTACAHADTAAWIHSQIELSLLLLPWIIHPYVWPKIFVLCNGHTENLWAHPFECYQLVLLSCVCSCSWICRGSYGGVVW